MRPACTSLLVAVSVLVGGLIVPASATAGGEPRRDSAADRVGAVLPAPQSVRVGAGWLPVPAEAGVVAAAGTDRATVEVVTAALRAAGARRVVPGRRPGLTVWIGGGAAPAGLPAGGYELVTGHGRVQLSGVDGDGLFHAAQTLRQLAAGHALPLVTIRDWPGMSWRGIIEGFYGPPWSDADRDRALDRAAATKMNTYVYAPKDDPYHRDRWRDPYPADQLADLTALAARARRDHVEFVFAVSPGQDLCYSSDTDFAALAAKDQALWDAGVRSFAVFFDDIDASLHCAADTARFGADPAPVAAAQAYLLNRFRHDFLATHPGGRRLVTVPTEYSGTGTSSYRTRLAALLDPDVLVYWTGPQVTSPAVGAADADAAHQVFGHDLLLWDNYPVNDSDQRRLFLGPIEGRAADLPAHGITGLTANPMVQAEPSAVALDTVADYAWNPAGYQAERSWQRALRREGGGAADALRALADNSRSSPLDPVESPALAARIAAFRTEWDAGRVGPATAALEREFTAMAGARDRLAMALPALATEAAPWLDKLHWYGVAGAAAVADLVAERRGDPTAAWTDRVRADAAAGSARQDYQVVAPGVAGAFLDQARARSRLVTVSAPAAQVPAGGTVTLTAAVPAGLALDRVEFRSGPTLLGTARTAPYRLDWGSVPTGLHLLTATAVAADGSAVTSAAFRLTAGAPAPALLVVGTDAPLAQGDVTARDRLEYLGLPVVVKVAKATTTADAAGAGLVVVSSTVASGDVGGKFRDVPVPVVDWESFTFDDFGMAGAPGETWNLSQVQVTDPTSPLAAGLTGTVEVYRGPNRLRWGTPGPAATVAATMPGNPAQATLFGYDTGAPLLDGTTAAARRVAIFLGDDGPDPDVLTPAGQRLFDTAVTWAVGGR